MKRLNSMWRKLRGYVQSIFAYCMLVPIALVLLTPCVLIALIFPTPWILKSRFFFGCLNLLYRAVVFLTGQKITIRGERVLSQGPAIIIANHQSALDIPLVGMLMHGYPHVWYVLDVYAKKPVLSWLVKKIGISVDQNNPTSAARALIKGIRMVENEHAHIIIFPEGGRYTDGKIHSFMPGVAILAKTLQRPVIPICMPDNYKVLPPGHFILSPHEIHVILGPTFTYQETDTHEQFIERVQAWFTQYC